MGIADVVAGGKFGPAVGPCDACSITSKYLPDHHALAVTACGRALCRGCDCGGNCYDRHISGCDPCSEISNQEVAKQMAFEAKKSMNLLDTSATTNRHPR